MEVVGVTTGVMKPLLSKLTKLLEEEYVKFKGVRKQIKFLRDELRAMSATLEMLADAEHLNPEMKLWRDKLRELAYDLEDCIDGFMARVNDGRDGPTGFKKYYRKLKRFIARHEIANQIEELKASVMEASERHRRYDFAQLKHNSTPSFVDPRLQALYEDIENLVGIDGPKKHMIEMLTMEMSDGSSTILKVVSISGCGGLGKTTLAKQVYDSVKGQFSCAAFVSVSRTPDVRKILICIAKGVKFTGINNITQDDDVQQLIDKLREHLHGNRYIVVIDDVWDTQDWEVIKLALPNNDNGSRIITTTRSVTVAKCCSSQVYEMDPLSFDDSKRLFFKRAFGSETSCYPHLEDVPDRILRKCGGLPLAIVTLSSMLKNELAKAEWDRVLRAIGSALANKHDAKNMTSIISLSYFDVPHHLRTCLLYLSVFPEDYVVNKQRLINRWIAEEFIREEEGRTKYEIGECYFNDLINRSMILPVNVKYGQANACQVHDIILDYIKCKAAEQNFVTSLDAADHVRTSGYMVRRLSVSNHTEESVAIWANPNLSQVRSVTIFGQAAKVSLFPTTALRVLDLNLQYCEVMSNHHLASIGKLFHLRYLRLGSDFGLIKLPEEIGELQYLQTLDVRGARIEELPSTIAKLQRLTHLYFNEYLFFPTSGLLGQMHNLEELRGYSVDFDRKEKSLQEFSKLTKLRTLELRWHMFVPHEPRNIREVKGLHSYVGTLLSSCNLYNLYITNDDDEEIQALSLEPCPAAPHSLQKLCITKYLVYKVPNWMATLGNLVVLKLDAIFCLRQEDIEILGAIPSLLFLKLLTAGGTKGRITVHRSNGFRRLKYFSLRIRSCGTALDFQVGSMPTLEHVKLKFHVHERDCLNGASSLGVQHLRSLSKVEVIIYGNCMDDRHYNPAEDENDGAIRWVASAINDAIVTCPNRPTVRFETVNYGDCEDLETVLWYYNHENDGVLTEWHESLQFGEEQTDEETEQEEDETDEEEEVEQTDEEEVAQ